MNEIFVESIVNFAEFLKSSAKKWCNQEWVNSQYLHHIEECRELCRNNDPHLQAELLDKLIISACLAGSDSNIFKDSVEELIESLKVGVVEFANLEELVEARTDKFIGKLHL